jgi:tetratricopeptide (TPR) repeat protein
MPRRRPPWRRLRVSRDGIAAGYGHVKDALPPMTTERRAAAEPSAGNPAPETPPGRPPGTSLADVERLQTRATTAMQLGHVGEAYDAYRQAVTLLRETGDSQTQAAVLRALAEVALDLGRPDEAYDAYRQAVTLLRKTGDFQTEAAVLGKLGLAMAQMDNLDEVYDDYLEAVLRAQETGLGATQKVSIIAEALVGMRHSYKDAMRARPPALRPVPDPSGPAGVQPGEAQKGA